MTVCNYMNGNTLQLDIIYIIVLNDYQCFLKEVLNQTVYNIWDKVPLLCFFRY